MLKATHGQNSLIIDYNNQLLDYNTHILGLIAVSVLAFPCFDYHGTTVTGCTRSAWHGTDRACKALARGDRNHPKDGIFRPRSGRAHVNTFSGTEGIRECGSGILERWTTGRPTETSAPLKAARVLYGCLRCDWRGWSTLPPKDVGPGKVDTLYFSIKSELKGFTVMGEVSEQPKTRTPRFRGVHLGFTLRR